MNMAWIEAQCDPFFLAPLLRPQTDVAEDQVDLANSVASFSITHDTCNISNLPLCPINTV